MHLRLDAEELYNTQVTTFPKVSTETTHRVWLNGEKVTETDKLMDVRLEAGRIGVQSHKNGASVEFRDIRVRPLR